MRESEVESAVCAFAKANGVSTLKLAGQHNRGKPDRIFMRKGKTIFVELKATGGKPTALQLKFLEGRRRDGFFAGWTDSPGEAIKWIKQELL